MSDQSADLYVGIAALTPQNAGASGNAG